jgi:excisionase family DNA binding protein
LRTNDFDPLAYIENAFLDTRVEPDEEKPVTNGNGHSNGLKVAIPTFTDFLQAERGNGKLHLSQDEEQEIIDLQQERPNRFRKTTMSAPRPRRAKQVATALIDPELQSTWTALPKNIEFLCSFYDDAVTANYYRGEFKENRQDLIRRLLDPELTLEETSRLLGVCPATVRRYTNRGWLEHHRTQGGQRRFRLSDLVRFIEEHGRFPEA